MQPQQRQLNEDEQEETQQFGARDVCTLWEVVREVVERGPDSRDHDLQALSSLEGLSAEPDTGDHATDKDGKIGPAYAKRGTREDWEVDAENTADVAIQHSWYADDDMADEDSQDGESWVESFGDGGGRHWTS